MHVLAVGKTEFGKSTLLQKVAEIQLKRGYQVCVLDPDAIMGDRNGWPAGACIFPTWEEFRSFLMSNSGYFAYVEEAGDSVDEPHRNRWLTSRSRHWGHSVTIIGQRQEMLDKSMREQCVALVGFFQSVEDADRLARIASDPRVKQLAELPPYHVLYSRTSRRNDFQIVDLSKGNNLEKFAGWLAEQYIEALPEPNENLMHGLGIYGRQRPKWELIEQVLNKK